MSVWYIAASNELMIDLDDYMRPSKSGCPWGEAFFRRRLRDAILDHKLFVSKVWLIHSLTDRHYHAIIRLLYTIPTLNRLVWQLHLGSDLYRGRADLMRFAHGNLAPTLLIMPVKIKSFREPNYICMCVKKHDTEEQFLLGDNACPVWRKVRGGSPWELFGKSPKQREKFVPLPIGEVPLELVTRCDIDTA